MDVFRQTNELLQIARQARRGARVVGRLPRVERRSIARAETRLRLIEGRQRLAAGGVRGEVRPTIIGVLDHHHLPVARRERLVCPERIAVVETRATAKSRDVVQAVIEADTWLEV